MLRKNLIEIEALSGKRFLIENDWSRIYKLEEKLRLLIKWTSRFPFIKFERQRYCSFRFRTEYTYLDSFFDKRYKVNCNLSQLASLFDVEFKEFDKTMVNHDVAKL